MFNLLFFRDHLSLNLLTLILQRPLHSPYIFKDCGTYSSEQLSKMRYYYILSFEKYQFFSVAMQTRILKKKSHFSS